MLPPPSRFFAPSAEHLFERTWRKPVLHGEAARFHRARQPLQKRLVVFHDQERAVGLAQKFGNGVHGRKSSLADTHHMAWPRLPAKGL